MKRGSHPERVVLLGQVGEDVGVEHSGLQEAAPQSGQLGAELAHVPADLLRHLLMAFLQLTETETSQDKYTPLILYPVRQRQISSYVKFSCSHV